jgi:hypothetical protein
MDGSPQRGSLHATTLWHFDAAERAPSTASKADMAASLINVRFTPESRHQVSALGPPLGAKSGRVREVIRFKN